MFNPFGIEGHYQDDGNGVYWAGPSENELVVAKLAKKQEIKSLFESELNVSGIYTTTEGWVVDARRHDLDNLKNLHILMSNINATTVSVRMHDDTMVNMPLSRLDQLCLELANFGLSLYQKKWQKMAELELAASVTDVKAITW